jgi:hypothetical protein
LSRVRHKCSTVLCTRVIFKCLVLFLKGLQFLATVSDLFFFGEAERPYDLKVYLD